MIKVDENIQYVTVTYYSRQCKSNSDSLQEKKCIKIVTVSYSQCLRKCATGIRQHFKCANIVRSLLAWQDALPASAC